MTGIMKVAFRRDEKVPVVHLKTLEGWFESKFAAGFDANGEPVIDPKRAKYIVTGGYAGACSIMRDIAKGLNASDVVGYDVEEEVRTLVDSEVANIYLYENFRAHGMMLPYTMDRKVLVSAKIPKVSYGEWNKFLKKLGSKWRIRTPRVERVIKRLELDRLTKDYDSL